MTDGPNEIILIGTKEGRMSAVVNWLAGHAVSRKAKATEVNNYNCSMDCPNFVIHTIPTKNPSASYITASTAIKEGLPFVAILCCFDASEDQAEQFKAINNHLNNLDFPHNGIKVIVVNTGNQRQPSAWEIGQVSDKYAPQTTGFAIDFTQPATNSDLFSYLLSLTPKPAQKEEMEAEGTRGSRFFSCGCGGKF